VVLLKSTDMPAQMSWPVAAAAGLVDATFAAIIGRANLRASWVNLRTPKPPRR
jgi:hypothetical protein